MIAKEIVLGMLAYNLVRAVTYVVAEKTDKAPRDFSFTQVRNVVNAFAPRIAAAGDQQEVQRIYQDMLYYASQALLPKRRRQRRAYPRRMWGKPSGFPKRRK